MPLVNSARAVLALALTSLSVTSVSAQAAPEAQPPLSTDAWTSQITTVYAAVNDRSRVVVLCSRRCALRAELIVDGETARRLGLKRRDVGIARGVGDGRVVAPMFLHRDARRALRATTGDIAVTAQVRDARTGRRLERIVVTVTRVARQP